LVQDEAAEDELDEDELEDEDEDELDEDELEDEDEPELDEDAAAGAGSFGASFFGASVDDEVDRESLR
jgi:hypothetical protein